MCEGEAIKGGSNSFCSFLLQISSFLLTNSQVIGSFSNKTHEPCVFQLTWVLGVFGHMILRWDFFYIDKEVKIPFSVFCEIKPFVLFLRSLVLVVIFVKKKLALLLINFNGLPFYFPQIWQFLFLILITFVGLIWRHHLVRFLPQLWGVAKKVF